MADIFYDKILVPLGEWWSTVNVDFLGLKVGGAGVNPFEERGSKSKEIRDQGNKAKRLLDWQPKIGIEQGVNKLLDNINLWKNAPIWDKKKIKIATADWFKYLK